MRLIWRVRLFEGADLLLGTDRLRQQLRHVRRASSILVAILRFDIEVLLAENLLVGLSLISLLRQDAAAVYSARHVARSRLIVYQILQHIQFLLNCLEVGLQDQGRLLLQRGVEGCVTALVEGFFGEAGRSLRTLDRGRLRWTAWQEGRGALEVDRLGDAVLAFVLVNDVTLNILSIISKQAHVLIALAYPDEMVNGRRRRRLCRPSLPLQVTWFLEEAFRSLRLLLRLQTHNRRI